ncbi:MAG: hypothetical protein ACXVCP_08075 [Bdellovibrio sp.]
MFYKILGTLIVATAVIIIAIVAKLDTPSVNEAKPVCIQLSPAEQLTHLINNDFQNLAKNKQLPEAWNSIATVDIKMNSQLAKALLGTMRPTFQKIRKGNYHLELDFLDLPDSENPGIIIQASLFEIKSKNKIFEVGRTYTMNDLNKAKPLAK